jgi:hypothetical protein
MTEEDGVEAIERIHGASIAEIHVDFILWEEFQTNREFLRQFVAHCAKEDDSVELDGLVTRSVANAFGESDLLVRCRNRAGKRIALLIEDKIGAALQPDQAERYRKRGEQGKPDSWDSFITCIVAPKRYIERVQGFDASVALESILDLDWLHDGLDRQRADFKRNVLKAAIEKERHSGPFLIDAAVTSFRQSYFDLLQRDFPEIRMNPPKACYAGETWFRLRHSCLPKSAWIHHKTERGFVDLSFPNVNEADLWKFRDCFDEGMRPIQTGQSASLRLIVTKVENFIDFHSQEAAVREGIAAALRLCQFFAREGARLSETIEKMPASRRS